VKLFAKKTKTLQILPSSGGLVNYNYGSTYLGCKISVLYLWFLSIMKKPVEFLDELERID
jgi:hypothetical protein